MTPKYNTIKKVDIANGPGCRVSLWTQGCTHHCDGCFNPETWRFTDGKVFSEGEYQQLIDYLTPEYIHGLSVLGGEPMDQPEWLCSLLKNVKYHHPDKTTWLYTGYTYEALSAVQKEVLEYVDVLVDGEFIEAQKVLDLRFRGSTNQRIIDVQKSIESGEVVEWQSDTN